MPRRKRSGNQRYHDRVAGQYEQIYNDAYWQWHDGLTWDYIKKHLPTSMDRPVLDVGCGTGKWGRKLLKSGFHADFVDLSVKMVDQAMKQVDEMNMFAKARFYQADVMDLSALDTQDYPLILAMGEPVGLAGNPRKALQQLAGHLAADGTLIATLDNRVPCVDHYVRENDPDALEAFLKSGKTHWLTRDPSERFEIHTFEPAGVEKLLASAGLSMVELIGKTVLPMRQHRDLLTEPVDRRRWSKIEKRLAKDPANLARCAHLQVAAKLTEAE